MSKQRRLKCRHCGKLVSRKSKNRYYCSLKCVKAAVKENNLPENKARIEAEREGLRFAKVPKKDRALLPEDALADKITYSEPAEYDSEKLNQTVADEMGQYLDAVKIPYDRELTGDAKHDIQQDLIDLGMCAGEFSPEGIRRIDPVSDEMAVMLHNARNPDSPIHVENMTLEEFRKKYPDANLPAEPSPWQGDAPEGTLAHKLKYGEWYKDGHEPR